MPAPDQPALTIVFAQYDRDKYARALQRLIGRLDALTAGGGSILVVDNRMPGDWTHEVSASITHVGGDNSAWEFSAFDKGLAWLEERGGAPEVVALATDALLAYGDEVVDLLDGEVIETCLRAGACVGWMDAFGEAGVILGHVDDVWMRTSLLVLPASVARRLRPLAFPLDDDVLFGESWREPFRADAPVSENLRRLLLGWLTTADGGAELETSWHSRFQLSEDTFALFKAKVKAILREHLLSARLRELAVPCYDLRAIRKAARAGARLSALPAEQAGRWRWLRWREVADVPAPSAPTLVFAAETVGEGAAAAAARLAGEVMPLIRQRHPAVRLLVYGDAAVAGALEGVDGAEVAPSSHLSIGLAGAAALLVPGTPPPAAAGVLTEAAQLGVPVVGNAYCPPAFPALDGRDFLAAQRSWELAEACCRLLEDRELRLGLADGARRLIRFETAGGRPSRQGDGDGEAGRDGPGSAVAEPAAAAAAGAAGRVAIRPPFPDGHFYSPVVDPAELLARAGDLWPDRPRESPAVDYRGGEQKALLAAVQRYAPDFDYPTEQSGDGGRPRFVRHNGKFEGLDARMWFCLLRHLRPRRVIEIGSGFSSLLAADVNHRFLAGAAELVCVEPYPPDFLREGVDGLDELVVSKVQDVPVAFFERLEAGDVLFVDSSHVAKTGSDVNYIYFEILPALRRGVVLHVHDIFLPAEYPRDWVLGEQRSWNEQYLVHALLAFSGGLEVLFGSAYASLRFPELVRQAFGEDCAGGSLWLRKIVGS